MSLQYDSKGKSIKRFYLFSCAWCSFKFEQSVETNKGQGKRHTVTDQVKCPRCRNFQDSYGGSYLGGGVNG